MHLCKDVKKMWIFVKWYIDRLLKFIECDVAYNKKKKKNICFR